MEFASRHKNPLMYFLFIFISFRLYYILNQVSCQPKKTNKLRVLAVRFTGLQITLRDCCLTTALSRSKHPFDFEAELGAVTSLLSYIANILAWHYPSASIAIFSNANQASKFWLFDSFARGSEVSQLSPKSCAGESHPDSDNESANRSLISDLCWA